MSAPYDAVYVCIQCGAVESTNPQKYEYDEFLCEACEEEMSQAQDFLMHMVQMTERK